MKIAFITGAFPAYSETFISRKVKYLLENGHDIHIFCDAYDKNVPHPKEWRKRIHVFVGRQSPIHCVFILLKALFRLLWDKEVRAAFQKLRREQNISFLRVVLIFGRVSMIAKGDWDVIHAHFLTQIDPIVHFTAQFRSTPVVCSVLGFDASVAPYSSYDGIRSFQKRVQAADGLIYSTEFLRRLVHANNKVNVPEKIIFPENDASLFRTKLRKNVHSPCRILTVGRLQWAKGYPFSLAAVRKLLDDGIDCEYRIIGEGNSRTEIEYLIRNMNLDGHVHLLGSKTPKEVASAMDWADIYLGMSSKEEFGTVFAEAAMSGLPIIANKIGGIPESTSENVTAFLVPRGDWKAASDSIKKLINAPDLYQEMSQAGAAFAQKYDINISGKQLVDFYQEVIRKVKVNI